MVRTWPLFGWVLPADLALWLMPKRSLALLINVLRHGFSAEFDDCLPLSKDETQESAFGSCSWKSSSFQEAIVVDVKVAVVHARHLIREGLAHVLRAGGVVVVAVVDNVDTLLSLNLRADAVDVFVISSAYDGGTTETSVQAIKRHFPDGKVIILSDFAGNGEHLAGAYAAGAAGFVTTDSSPAILIEYVRLVALGARAFPAPMERHDSGSSQVSRASLAGHLPRRLSDRERDILLCLVAGNSNKSIGRKLSITESTVKAHVRSILRKLGAENRTQAAIWAAGTISELQEQA